MKRPVVLGILVVVGVSAAAAGFEASFGTWRFLPPAIGAAVLACTVAVLAHRRNIAPSVSLAVSWCLAFVAGAVLILGNPTPAGIGKFARQAGDGLSVWLSTSGPISSGPPGIAVPFLMSWLCAAVGFEVASRGRHVAYVATGPLLGLGITTALSDPHALGATIAAAAVVLVALAMVALRSFASGVDDLGWNNQLVMGRTAVAASLVLISVLLGSLLATNIDLTGDRDRLTLRSSLGSDDSPLRISSPLSAIKASLGAGRSDDAVMTVTGPPVSRVRLATFDAFDGTVWFLDSQASGDGLQLVGGEPLRPSPAVSNETQRHVITLGDLGGRWLPSPGIPTMVKFEDPAGKPYTDAEPPTLYFDTSTGSLLSNDVLPSGTRVEVESYPVRRPSDDELANARVWSGTPNLSAVPPAVRQLKPLALRLTANQPNDFAKAAELEAFFRGQRYDPTAPTGHTSRHLIDLFEDSTIAAFDEQFATGFAVLARLAGLPARVVVGYRTPTSASPTESVEITAGDIEAWVEVAFEGFGWVPFSAVPDDQSAASGARPASGDNARSSQAPSPESRQTTPTTTPPPTVEIADQDTPVDGGRLLALGVAIVMGGLVIAAGVSAVIGRKALRKRRRKREGSEADRVIAAWDELVDRAIDDGADIDRTATIRETAQRIYAHTPAALVPLQALGEAAERCAFSPTAPDPGTADASWELADQAVNTLHSGKPGARVRSAVSTRSITSTRSRRVESDTELTGRR